MLYRRDLYAAFKYFLFPAGEMRGTELLLEGAERWDSQQSVGSFVCHWRTVIKHPRINVKGKLV